MTNPDPSNIGSQVLPGQTLDDILDRSDALNPPIGAEVSAWLSDFTAWSSRGVEVAAEVVRASREEG